MYRLLFSTLLRFISMTLFEVLSSSASLSYQSTSKRADGWVLSLTTGHVSCWSPASGWQVTALLALCLWDHTQPYKRIPACKELAQHSKPLTTTAVWTSTKAARCFCTSAWQLLLSHQTAHIRVWTWYRYDTDSGVPNKRESQHMLVTTCYLYH